MYSKISERVMNKEDRTKILEESKLLFMPLMAVLKKKELSDDAASTIEEILILCVEYGYNQGFISGSFNEQKLLSDFVKESSKAKQDE